MPAIDAGMVASGGMGGTAATGGTGGQPPGVPDAATPLDPSEWADEVGFVGEHGPLRVHGNRVIDGYAQPIQLRGMSLFWTQWTDFYVAQNVDTLVDGWQATVVRAALGVENDGGYLSNPQANVDKVRAVVDRAIERGVYVIIDWHDHHAQDHVAQARSFFEQMALAYGEEPHVIFEVYNEPMDVSWPVVKSYAEDIIQTIRAAGSDNLIIVGTPTWSQDVDVAAADPITSDDNVAYTLHFYADTHKQLLRAKAGRALSAGIALFVTEWGTCSADGNGAINEAETQTWLGFLRDNSIGWANWSLHNKDEACSAIVPSAGATGPWGDDQLTTSGRLVKAAIP
jgi:endoglucanase